MPGDPEWPATWDTYAALLPHAEIGLSAESQGMRQIASYLGASGNRSAARALLRQIVSASEQVLGSEHPGTLMARASLARWTGESGDSAAARDQLALLIPVMERALGADHPQTVTHRGTLASWTGHAGDAAAARDQLAALLPIADRVLGPEHSGTLAARANHARWTGLPGILLRPATSSPLWCRESSRSWGQSIPRP